MRGREATIAFIVNFDACRSPFVIAFLVPDMTSVDSAGSIIKAVRALDDDAVVHINLATSKVRISPSTASESQLIQAIRVAGYTPATG
jgi:copper chaperone CopZ